MRDRLKACPTQSWQVRVEQHRIALCGQIDPAERGRQQHCVAEGKLAAARFAFHLDRTVQHGDDVDTLVATGRFARRAVDLPTVQQELVAFDQSAHTRPIGRLRLLGFDLPSSEIDRLESLFDVQLT